MCMEILSYLNTHKKTFVLDIIQLIDQHFKWKYFEDLEMFLECPEWSNKSFLRV